MNTTFSGDIARMQRREQIARATQLHELERSRRSGQSESPREGRPSRTTAYFYRKALAAVALTSLFLSLMTTVALAAPVDPGGRSGSVEELPISTPAEQVSPSFELWPVVALCALVVLALVATQIRKSHRPAFS